MNISIKNELQEQIKSTLNTSDDIKIKFLDFIEKYPDNFNQRENTEGHITASTLVVDKQREHVLLTHHAKYHCWLQLGGHWDFSEESCLDTALREMKEEGYDNVMPEHFILNNSQPFDIDMHWIGDHHHFDVCFLVEVDKTIPISCSHESHAVEWKKIDDMIVDRQDIRLSSMLKKFKVFSEQIYKD